MTGTTDVGGLIGHAYNTRVYNCFWNTETSGQPTSDSGTGKFTWEMKWLGFYTIDDLLDNNSYIWDFVGTPNDDDSTDDIWNIDPNVNNGYPYLVNLKPK